MNTIYILESSVNLPWMFFLFRAKTEEKWEQGGEIAEDPLLSNELYDDYVEPQQEMNDNLYEMNNTLTTMVVATIKLVGGYIL
jgi:hypothetical protein